MHHIYDSLAMSHTQWVLPTYIEFRWVCPKRNPVFKNPFQIQCSFLAVIWGYLVCQRMMNSRWFQLSNHRKCDQIHKVQIVRLYMGYALNEANNFKNGNLSNSRYQKNYNTIEFCDIDLVENKCLKFQIFSFSPFFRFWKLKTLWVLLGKSTINW